MLALIIGLLSILSPSPAGNSSPLPGHHPIFADSIKFPSKHKKNLPDTGKRIQINRIFLIGNRITRDQIILRELQVKEGDIVFIDDLPRMLDLDKKKLFNTRLFNKVDIKILDLDAERIDLVIDLDERWYTFPAPLFELSDRNFNEWWQNYNHDFRRVNYGLRLYQYNMRGRNETLRLHAQLGYQHKFEILYRLPYIDRKKKQGLTFEAAYLETKNLAAQTVDHKYVFSKADKILKSDKVAAITYSYRGSFYRTHSLKAEYRKTEIADTVKSINPIYIKGETKDQLQYFNLSYQFNADHRDYLAYPLKGYQFTAAIGRSGVFRNDDVKRWEMSFLFSKYFDLGKNFYLANNTIGYYSNQENLSYANFAAMGLRKQFVRGYEIYVIEGPQWFLNKTTFKKKIFSRTYEWKDMPVKQFRHVPISIYMKSYVDIGSVKNYPDYEAMGINTRLAEKLLTGVGGGFDIIGSYDVVLRLEYTFNAEGQNGFFFHIKKEF